jgi:hypothetical protein
VGWVHAYDLRWGRGRNCMACKRSEVDLGASNLPATAPRVASRGSCALARVRLSTFGIVMQKPAAPGTRGRGRSLHTAEPTTSRHFSPSKDGGHTSRTPSSFPSVSQRISEGARSGVPSGGVGSRAAMA